MVSGSPGFRSCREVLCRLPLGFPLPLEDCLLHCGWLIGEIQSGSYVQEPSIVCPKEGRFRHRHGCQQMGVNVANTASHQSVPFDEEEHLIVGGHGGYR